ncbi:hypothetical protein WH47_01712 [Habropoda laboriosa]|uniref:Uncharacterized protein n=1 Tax=Habropoda laboriosa TaxID=597456 RepID=A0A0L7QJW5_9HYME|nr:hypothetical protein WH47_01712 [Habropoda laboriosa]
MKQRELTPGLPINTSIIHNLTGIGSGMIRTLGEIIIPIREIPIQFQVVPDNFSISQTGILGVSFLQKQKATLTFRENLPSVVEFEEESLSCTFSSHDLPLRTKILIAVSTFSKLKTGYVRQIDAGHGIFAGEVLASQRNNLVKLFVINSTFDHVTLTIPAIELESVDVKPPGPRSSKTDNSNKSLNKDNAQRIAQVI